MHNNICISKYQISRFFVLGLAMVCLILFYSISHWPVTKLRKPNTVIHYKVNGSDKM